MRKRKKKILIADDEENLLRLYKDELEEEGYEVIIATNGKQALEILDTDPPDLLILDIRMPGMDGIETLGKALDKNSRLPVILNTAYSAYKDNFMSWSADAYIIKSSDLTELKKAIKSLIG